ncbi:MAG: endonuclease [Candidatus Moranbacteria bacterium CG_4_8_14_3_um_filter_43_15]|nr:MAG: endonuclease [Candidatus Moranbacteria bacterium CG_4_8_14_3_um_filter_43_15]PJA86246.1 MAG: endonuclease [Candidatus Moranbacteria bacterium CG_4_9_14_3_um_filter_44_28]
MDFAMYISGFVDGEGCFCISFNFREKLKTKIEVRPSFAVSQNKRNLDVLKKIRDYFGCGNIRFSKNDQNYKFEVRNISELRRKIIPHFKSYPLQTTKRADFQIFEEICDLVARTKHRNPIYLKQIIDFAYQMNISGKRRYKKAELLSVLDKMKI